MRFWRKLHGRHAVRGKGVDEEERKLKEGGGAGGGVEAKKGGGAGGGGEESGAGTVDKSETSALRGRPGISCSSGIWLR